jgi:hypothetical protein
MRKLQSIVLVTTLGLSLANAPTSQAKSKITKPSAPTISSISSSTPKKGKVNVTVTITLSASNGGSKITGSKVSAGGKSCTIKKTKTSCTIKSIKNGKSLKISAKSKNKKGFSSASTSVTYTAGSGSWPTAPVAAPAPLTCATGGTCVVGDRGPGGGIVYYVDNAGFNCGSGFTATGSPTGGKCKYLEVAPSGWDTGNERADGWAVSSNRSMDVSGITNEISANNSSSGIGLGYKNSALIVTQNGSYNASTNNYAAGAARAYAGNSKSDWYLPTTAELNLLCQWNRGVSPAVGTACTLGAINSPTYGASGSGFFATYYWSSSEDFANNAWNQYFSNGAQGSSNKGNTGHARPVRAF